MAKRICAKKKSHCTKLKGLAAQLYRDKRKVSKTKLARLGKTSKYKSDGKVKKRIVLVRAAVRVASKAQIQRALGITGA